MWCLCHYMMDNSYIMECPFKPPGINMESRGASKIFWKNELWILNQERTTTYDQMTTPGNDISAEITSEAQTTPPTDFRKKRSTGMIHLTLMSLSY